MSAIKRREFIRRLGLTTGAAILTPAIDALIQRAYGQTPAVKRFVNYRVNNGIHPADVQAVVRSQTDFDLPMSLSGFENVRPKLNIFKGLVNTGHSFLHRTSWSSTTSRRCHRTNNNDNLNHGAPQGPSMDYLIASHLSPQAPRIVILGQQTMSSRGNRSPMGSINDPRRAWSQLLQNINNQPNNNQEQIQAIMRERASKNFLLDFLVKDIKAAQRGLAGEESQKLEEYLEGINQIRPSNDQIVINACERPNQPAAGDCAAWVRGHVTVGTALLACNLANVVSIGTPADGGNRFLKFASVGANAGQHAIHHGARGGPSNLSPQQAFQMIYNILRFHSQQIAGMYQVLSTIPEPGMDNTSIADNLVISWTSDGDSHHKGGRNMVAITLGDLGGAIRTTGNHITYSGGNSRNLCEYWFTLAKAFGHPMQTFGDGSDNCRGVLPGIV